MNKYSYVRFQTYFDNRPKKQNIQLEKLVDVMQEHGMINETDKNLIFSFVENMIENRQND